MNNVSLVKRWILWHVFKMEYYIVTGKLNGTINYVVQDRTPRGYSVYGWSIDATKRHRFPSRISALEFIKKCNHALFHMEAHHIDERDGLNQCMNLLKEI